MWYVIMSVTIILYYNIVNSSGVHVYLYLYPIYKWKFKGTTCEYITHVLHRETFCACTYTAQRNLRIAWRLQNRILVSVKIKLQAITSSNDNSFPRNLEGAGTSQLYHSLYSVWDCTALGLSCTSSGSALGSTCAALVQYISHTL